MQRLLVEDHPLSDKGEALVDRANEYGGEDNITVVIVEYAAVTESG